MELDSDEAFKIKIKLANGDQWFSYVDSETLLEVMRSYERVIAGVRSEVCTYFSDFVEVDGVTLPGVIESESTDGTPFAMIFDEYKTNVEIDDAVFQMERKTKD